MSKETEQNIYAVRGICAILIVIYHYSVYYSDYIAPISLRYFRFGWLTVAVPIFFIFSSFFLYAKAVQIRNTVKLVVYRMIRLFPMYWIAVIWSSIVILLGEGTFSIQKYYLI